MIGEIIQSVNLNIVIFMFYYIELLKSYEQVMISTKQLIYALAVEKHLHFKRAAEQCHISQSALSTALNELESQLGIQIFERDNRKVLVTPLGKEVLNKARDIIAQVESLEKLADQQKEPLSFPVTIGIIPTIAPFLLPLILPILNQRYPHSEVTIVEQQSQVLVDMVRRGEIDSAVLALPYTTEGLLAMEFWQEDFYWVAHEGQKFTDLKEITSHELSESKLMLLSEGHCLKDHILDACKLSGVAGSLGMGATSLNTLIQMVIGNLGTTLIPAMALSQLLPHSPELRAVHLNEPGPHRKIAFVIRPSYSHISSIQILMEISKTALSDNQ